MVRHSWTKYVQRGLIALPAITLGVLLARAPVAAQYEYPEHTHLWNVDPPMGTPYIMVDEEYPLTEDVISI